MIHTQLILGLPKAGKTTFIAALWYVVETRRVAGALELAELPANRSHLNSIRQRWGSCEEQEHTNVASEREIKLKLREPNGGSVTELVVPDLSGESLELQWSHRQWSHVYNELALRATGALLFVHPAAPAESATLADEEALGSIAHDATLLGLPAVPNDPASDLETDVGEKQWEPSDAPPEAKLVELLQFLTVQPIPRAHFRLAVIISAWDRAKKAGVTPAEWLRRSSPLLDQFLKANDEVFRHRVYGVSATGGDLKADAERLLAERDPVNWIEVVGPMAAVHDITAPIRYVMNVEP